MKMIFRILLLITLPNLALAHTAEGGGFWAGLYHPVLGLDHLLAMVSVGILSAQIGGSAIWTVPATFVIVMLLGGFAGISGVEVPSIELGIALSVVVLGLAIAIDKQLPTSLALLVVAFFAIFHGNAHGLEMPDLAEPINYALGFITATAGLHISGVFIGLGFKLFKNGKKLLSYAGATILGMGLHILIGL